MKQKLLTLISIMLLPIVASRAATEIGGIYYNLSETGAEVTKGSTSYSGAVIIPSSVTFNGNVYSVTSIGEKAFQYCRSLTSVTIPNSVTSIGTSAFNGCSSLTSITIPNSVTSIGNYAFGGCSGLTSVTIPNSVTSIGNNAFSVCSGLTSVTIGSGVTSIGNYAFSGCGSLTSVTIGNSVTSIGEGAFSGCSGLTSVTIPNSVTSIGERAFNNCSSLTSITIPNSVTSIGKEAFSGCSSLTSITIPESMTTIGDYALSGCSGLTTITIPNSVTSIGGNAFSYCSGLTSVTIPNSVTSIGDYAFYGCSGLTSITIPNSVTSIGNYAFRNCSGLTSVTIGSGVTSIGNSAFSGCTGLTSVTIPNSVTSIGNYAFSGCSGLTSITIPGSVTSIERYAFYGCSNLSSIIIPESVTSIVDYAFENCSGLTSITIPNSVTSIGNYAFRDCSGLSSITIGNGLTSISGNAFAGCNVLTSIEVESGNTKYDSRNKCNAIIETETNALIAGCRSTTIPNSVTSIGNDAFNRCGGLTSITIPNSVTSIGNDAFYSCSGLTSVTIPNSVTSIGSYAFQNCSSLTSITIPNSVTSIGNSAFSNCSGLTSITIGSGVTSMGNYVFSWCSGLTSVTILDGMTSIGSQAFYSCSGLTTVTIPNSVTSIGSQAFYSCSGLTTVTIPNSVTSIGTNPFSGCSALTSIVVESGNTKYDSRNNCNAIIETETNTIITGCKNASIPVSVTSIGERAFYGCSGLTSITIPNSVTSIGNYAFYGCSGLTSVTSKIQEPFATGNNAFTETSNNTILYVPAGTKSQYHALADWNRFMNIVEITENEHNWTIGKGGDFADIKAAMEDSRVQDGHVMQILKGTTINANSYVNKAVTIKGNGYMDKSDGFIGSVYINCDNVTLRQLYLDNVYIRANDATVEHCRASNITGTSNYDSDNATIRGCFVIGTVQSHPNNIAYEWNISGNIFINTGSGNTLDYLEESTLDHNLIINYNNESGAYAVGAVNNSSFTNNIFLGQTNRPGISPDAVNSATKLEYNMVSNTETLSDWPTNMTGYNELAMLFVCTGSNMTDAYYELKYGSPAIGYANDGGNCGPWSGKSPYTQQWELCPTITDDPVQHKFSTLDALINNISNIQLNNVTVYVTDATYIMDIIGKYSNIDEISDIKDLMGWLNDLQYSLDLKRTTEYLEKNLATNGITINMEAQQGAIFLFNIWNSPTAKQFRERIATIVKEMQAQGTTQDQGQIVAELNLCNAMFYDIMNSSLDDIKRIFRLINTTNITFLIDPTQEWKLDPKLTTDPEQYEFASLEALMNYLTDTKNIQKLPEGTTVNVAVADTTFAMDAIQDYSNENDVDGLLKLLLTETYRMKEICFWLSDYCKAYNITINMEAQQGAVFQFYIQNSQAYKHAQELMAAKEKELLAQGMNQTQVDQRIADWQTSLDMIVAIYRDLIPYIFQSINTTNITIQRDPMPQWKLDPKLTTNAEQHEFATLDELIGYMTGNLNNLKESVTVNVADATYTMDVLSYLFGKTKYDNVESMIEFIRARSEVLLAQMDYMSSLISQGITFNLEAPHEAIFQFNIQNSESLALINMLMNDQVAAWLAQGMSQGEVEQRIASLSRYIADTQTQTLRAMKRLTDIITLTNISVYIDGKLYPADPTNWKLDPKLTTDPEQYEFASLEALMNYLTDTKNIQKLPEGTTVNVAVADTTFTMDAIQDYSNVNDVDELLNVLWDETYKMENICSWLSDYCNDANITINMVAQQGAVFQFYIQYSQAFKHAQELMAAKEKELLAQGMNQTQVDQKIAPWQQSLYTMVYRYRGLIPDIFQSINTTNITIQYDPMPQWKLDPKLTTNAEQHEFATLDGFVNYLLDNCFNLKESIKVNVADATYTMDVIPNLGNSNDVEVLILVLEKTCNDFDKRVAEIMKWFQGNNITINMEAPHAAVLQFNIRNSQAVKQIQKAIPAKMQEMLAQGMSQDEVNLQAAVWYNNLEKLIEYSYSGIHGLFSLIKTTNISLVVDPTQQWKLDPKLNNNPEQHEFATLEVLVSYLLTHPLTESITVNVADATYSMEMMPNDIDFNNYSVDEALGLVRQKMSVIKAMLDYYAAYPLISIYMKAPNDAIFKIYMQKCLALYYQIPAYLNYKAYEMLAEGKSRTEVAQQMAAWKAEFEVIKNEALNYMQMLANRLRTTNISILIDPDDDLVSDLDYIIIDPDDMLCLWNLYDRLGGSSWTNMKWKFNGYMAQKEDFPGVTFDDEGYVVEINLENNNLRGSLNPSGWTWELGLPRLSGLYLQKNNISGNLSPWLHDTDRAGRLKTLDMSYNNLTKISESIPSSITSLNLKNQNREWYRPSGVTIDPLKIEVMANMQTVRLYLSSKQKVSLPSLFTYNHQNQTHDAKPDIHIVNAQGLDKYGSFYSTTEGSYALSWMNEEYTEKQDAPCYIRFGGPYDGSVYPAYLRYIEGDADISGYTDLVDVQTTLNYVLAGGGVSQFNRSAANTYVDNQINVQDIVCTVNIILDDVAAPEDIVTTPSSTRRRLRRAAEAIDAQGWLYTNQGCVMISSAEEVGSIDVELKGVSTRQVSLMLNHSQYQMIGRDTEFGSRYIIFSPTGQPIPASEEVTLLAVSSQAEVVAAQAADMEAREMTLAIGQPTGIAQVLGGSMNATFQGDELVVTTTTDIQNLSLRLYGTGGQMVLVNEEDNMPKGELRMKAPVSPGAYILEMTTRQGGRKIVKLMKR